MAQPLLSLQHRSGGAPQVFRITGATSAALGNTLGAAVEDDTTNGAGISNYNRVIQFQGDVYAAASDGVYKKDDPTTDTGAWSQDYAFPNPAPANRAMHVHGPYQIVLNGVQSIFVIWSTSTSTSTWNAAILNGNTDVWSAVGEQAAVTATNATFFGKSIVYRSALYVCYQGGLLTFDPGAGSFGVISIGSLDMLHRAGIGIFNDRLLLLGRNGGTGDIGLNEVTGGAISLLFDTSLAAHGTGVHPPRNTLVPSPDGSVLYAFCPTTTGGAGLGLLKIIDTAGTLSEDSNITTPVIPASLRPGAGTTTARTWAFYDQETTPGSAVLEVFYAPNSGDGDIITNYQFVDESTVLTQIDQGASATYAYSAVMTGGGERIFTPGELHIEIVDRLAVLGGEAIRFKAWGDAGPADKNVEFRFNTENEVPLVLATLSGTPSVVSGPAAAPTLNVGLQRLESVEADGVSVYETTWAIASDSVSAGQRAQLVPRVFI